MVLTLPAGVIPVVGSTTTDILYGSRATSFRFEVLTHNPVTRVDALAGILDGVAFDGKLSWSASAQVKKSGTINVVDLAVAGSGFIRVGDIDLVAARIRPVMVIEGLPEVPLGVYLITASPQTWTAVGRSYAIELHDKSTVLDQDILDVSFTAPAGAGILATVASVIASAGEQIAVDASEARTLPTPLVWLVGTTKLTIVNDLLAAIQYNAIWVDQSGAFRATPYIVPVKRSILYTVLNDASGQPLTRKLADGPSAIYAPDWGRLRDSYGVPNKVVAVQAGTSATTAPLSGQVTNVDPTSPYSYPSRGRWITHTLTGVTVPDYSAASNPTASTVAFLTAVAQQSLIESSAVQATVTVTCLPIPVELLEVVEFSSVPAGIDSRHTIQSIGLDLTFDGLMALTLQEVVAL